MKDIISRGRPPFGYDMSKNGYTINKVEVKVLREIFRLILAKKTKTEIIKHLTKKSYKTRTGTDWTYTILQTILNEDKILKYTGRFKNDFGEERLGAWEPIIEDSEKDELLDTLEIYANQKAPKTTREAYLLTQLGIAKCGHCNGPIRATYSAKTPERKHYQCTHKSTKQKVPKCEFKLLRMDDVDVTILTDLIVRAESINKIEKYIDEYHLEVQDKCSNEIAQADKKLSDLLKKQLTASTIKDIDKINNKISSNLEYRKNKIIESISKFDVKLLRKAKNIKAMKIESQRKLIQNCIEKIWLYSDQIVVCYKFPIDKDLGSIVKFEYTRTHG